MTDFVTALYRRGIDVQHFTTAYAEYAETTRSTGETPMTPDVYFAVSY